MKQVVKDNKDKDVENMIERLWPALCVYYVLINALSVCVMRADKRRAARRASRISERRLFLLAWLGGAWGIRAGMKLYRHKTRRATFVWGIPMIGVIHLSAIIFLYIRTQIPFF